MKFSTHGKDLLDYLYQHYILVLKPTAACKPFSDYANIIYLPYIKKQLRSAQRVDVICDRYIEYSLKVQTRSKRGTVSAK